MKTIFFSQFSFLIFILPFSFIGISNAQWQQTTALGGLRVNCFAVNGQNLFAGTLTGGIFLTTDSGTSWTAKNNGLTDMYVTAFVISGTNMFASTYSNGVFLSTDSGANWTAVNSGLTNLNIRALVISGANLLAGTYGDGVFKSTNNGSSWTAVLSSQYILSLATNDTNVFAGTNASGAFLSTNNGTNWTGVNNGLTDLVITSIAINGINIYAGTDQGRVFTSSNNGTNWSQASSGLTGSMVTGFAIKGTDLFAGDYGGGVFLSADNGTNWNAINNGLGDMTIFSLCISGTTLFCGNSGNIVWKISTLQLNSISGTIFKNDSTTQITSGNVYLINYDTSAMQFAYIDSFLLSDSIGNYNFDSVPVGDYLILAKPNPDSFPNTIPFYYGDTAYWKGAIPLNFTSNSSGVNITVKDLPQLSGPGYFTGMIQYGIGSGKTGNGTVIPFGDPVPDIDIILEEIPGGIKAHATTDNNGVYGVGNLPANSTFRLLVDIPGLPMDSSYTITIPDTTFSPFTNLDFVVDTTTGGAVGSGAGIYIGYPLGMPDFGLDALDFKVYPNPNNGTFTIKFNASLSPLSLWRGVGGEVKIFNVLGEIVYLSSINGKQQTINFISPPGIYNVQVEKENGIFNKKIIVE